VLGTGSGSQSLVPAQVTGLTSGVTAISAGNAHTCAVVSGAANCWGYGGLGQLGVGTTFASWVPVAVSGLTSGVTAISAGSNLTCAVAAGVGRCWGNNGAGQLGNGTSGEAPTPVQVSGLTSGVTALASGASHSCAAVSGGARCWGQGGFQQLGSGSDSSSYVPVQVSGLTSGVTAVAAGYTVGCAVASGAASCWGPNDYGSLGNGSSTESNVPVQVSGLTSGVTAIDGGYRHVCAVASGAAWCWGANPSGQLGNGSTTGSSVPVQVSGLTSGVTAIGTGYTHSCALVSGGVWCWGGNSQGQLGNGTTTASSVPVPVQGLTSGVTAIDTGNDHSCAVASGAVWCWGDNGYGQLGDGSTTDSLVPVQVSGLTSGATAVSGGAGHTCAVVSGAASCWGNGANSRLGNGSLTNSSVPVPVTGLTAGVTAISAGDSVSCAAVSGSAKCWGTSTSGQLGEVDTLVPNTVSGGLTWGTALAAPTISGSRSPAANANGWNNEAVTVTFTCVSTSLATCTSPQTVSGEGADQSVTGTVTDTAAQTASTTVSGISIDTTPPTLTGLAAAAPNAAGWYRAPVTMDWTCTDARSGIAAGACPASSATVGEGSSVSVSASVSDKAGNTTTASSESVKVDLTAPSTGASAPPTWSNQDVTLTLSSSDALSGVARTEYRVDGGDTQTGTAPVVSGQGVHTLEFWSTDVAGNVEGVQTVTVRIDTDAPSITGVRSPAPNSHGWNNTDVEVTFTCGDTGGSGVVSCPAAQSFTGEVDTTASATVSDAAGNTASEHVPVRIDRSAPTVTAQVPPANANGWFNAAVQVPFSCSDTGGSGIDSCPAPVVFAGEGADQPVTATATDNAGNTGSASGATVSIDTTPPTITGASVQPSNPGGGYIGTVTVHWTCDDARSGVVACPADQKVSGEGIHVVSASVSDRAGNTSTGEVTIQINHDPSTDPGVVRGTITDDSNGQPVAGATVTLRTPSRAIVATTTSGTDGTYVFPAVADGTYQLYSVLNRVYQGRYTASTFTVRHGSDVRVDQALLPALVVSGVVRTPSGDPISGATVRVSSTGAAISDADGRYRMTGVLPSAVTVRVFAYGSVPSDPVSFTMTADRVYDPVLQPSPAGRGIKGTITALSGGAPLAGATVRVWPKDAGVYALSVATGADGRFSLASLPVGTYEVDVIRPYYQVRWFGDSLERTGAAPITITTACPSQPGEPWGDPCATVVNVAQRR
jgi:alpha-tubulin suppressor-like RCC1 family protein